jgi:hypothetical protein
MTSLKLFPYQARYLGGIELNWIFRLALLFRCLVLQTTGKPLAGSYEPSTFLLFLIYAAT